MHEIVVPSANRPNIDHKTDSDLRGKVIEHVDGRR